MEALPYLQGMNPEELRRLMRLPEFSNLPIEQQRQIQGAYGASLQAERQERMTPEEQRQSEQRAAQYLYGFRPVPVPPPAPPAPGSQATPAQGPPSIADAIAGMGGELPNFEMQPRAPAPPVPASAERPPAPAPVARPSAPAAGAAPAARPTQPGIEDVIAQRLGALKPPESAQSFMDSPYLALVQAGLSMIADSRGKSALEAIAGGGRAGLQTLAQQRADQRAREEKNYERQLNRLKIESDLRDSMGRLQNYQDTTRLKEMELEEARRRGASALEIQRLQLEIDTRRAAASEQANILNERRQAFLEGQSEQRSNQARVDRLNDELRALIAQYGRVAAGTPEADNLKDQIDYVRNQLSRLGHYGQPQERPPLPARPSS
jgi:hypothetical protein